MFRSHHSRAISADLGEIERRLRALERNLERVGARTSASATQAADRIAELVAAALTSMAAKFRSHAAGVSGDAAKLSGDVVRLSRDTAHRLGREIEQRPIVVLAVAVAVGILVGWVSSQRR